MKKSISVLLAVIVMAGLVAACGGGNKKSDEKKTPEEMLKGKWEIVEATGDFADLNLVLFILLVMMALLALVWEFSNLLER
jgi:hypothetical protein